MKVRNVILSFKDQLPLRRLLKNIIKGSIIGLLSKRSHYRDNGAQKVIYNTRKSALKAAASMSSKYDRKFDTYKCLYCDGYHIGSNRDDKKEIK